MVLGSERLEAGAKDVVEKLGSAVREENQSHRWNACNGNLPPARPTTVTALREDKRSRYRASVPSRTTNCTFLSGDLVQVFEERQRHLP